MSHPNRPSRRIILGGVWLAAALSGAWATGLLLWGKSFTLQRWGLELLWTGALLFLLPLIAPYGSNWAFLNLSAWLGRKVTPQELFHREQPDSFPWLLSIAGLLCLLEAGLLLLLARAVPS